MENERAATIQIGGEGYELVLTTRATKEIGSRYGGLENLGDKLMKSENFELALDEICWLLALLANQSILIHNFKNPGDKKELLTVEALELLTSPLELASYKEAITAAMYKGYGGNARASQCGYRRVYPAAYHHDRRAGNPGVYPICRQACGE